LCNALIKIHIKNAANLNPDPFFAKLKFSHPELIERLKALKHSPESLLGEDYEDSETMGKAKNSDETKDVPVTINYSALNEDQHKKITTPEKRSRYGINDD
jgi:hypothetical protein